MSMTRVKTIVLTLANLCSIQDELQLETRQAVGRVKELEQAAETWYRPEPLPGALCSPPVTNASQKSGYLFLRS